MIDYWRQLDLVSPANLDFDVTIVGVGGLGSPIALALAKMGCPRLTLWDDDRVEPHNLPNQLYRLADIDRPKVEALAEIVTSYAEAVVIAHEARYVDQPLAGVVVSGVDSMASRATIWQGVRYRASVPLYLDARMGGEVGRVLAVSPVNPESVRRYEATLYADAEANEDPCTAQATIYGTFALAALVANQVKRFAMGQSLVFDQILDLATLTLLTDD